MIMHYNPNIHRITDSYKVIDTMNNTIHSKINIYTGIRPFTSVTP